MEKGELNLKAWGIGFAPQAQIHFEGEILLKDQYFPLTGFFTKGTTVDAYRCTSCTLVCFEYGGVSGPRIKVSEGER